MFDHPGEKMKLHKVNKKTGTAAVTYFNKVSLNSRSNKLQNNSTRDFAKVDANDIPR